MHAMRKQTKKYIICIYAGNTLDWIIHSTVHQIVLDWLGTNKLKAMFPSHEVVWLLSVLFGAIGGIITVLFVRMWENNGAAEVKNNRVPQENDERFG